MDGLNSMELQLIVWKKVQLSEKPWKAAQFLFSAQINLHGDFELQFQVKLINNELNSGVQIRSQCRELNDKEKARGDKNGRVNGPQVEIEATKEKC